MVQKRSLEVKKNKSSGQLFINIPKKSDLKEGDYAVVYKIIDNNKENKE